MDVRRAGSALLGIGTTLWYVGGACAASVIRLAAVAAQRAIDAARCATVAKLADSATLPRLRWRLDALHRARLGATNRAPICRADLCGPAGGGFRSS